MSDDLYLLMPTRVIHALETNAPDAEILDYLQEQMHGENARDQAVNLLAFYKELMMGSAA